MDGERAVAFAAALRLQEQGGGGGCGGGRGANESTGWGVHNCGEGGRGGGWWLDNAIRDFGLGYQLLPLLHQVLQALGELLVYVHHLATNEVDELAQSGDL